VPAAKGSEESNPGGLGAIPTRSALPHAEVIGQRFAAVALLRRKRLTRLLRKLLAHAAQPARRDQLLLRIGAAKKEAGQAFSFVKIRMPELRSR
jgi:hypothetical protein